MSYRDRLTGYNARDGYYTTTIYASIQAPEKLSKPGEIASRDRLTISTIETLESLLSDLKEYRGALAARYAELEAMSYKKELRLIRTNRSYQGIRYTVSIVRILEDNSEVDELREIFSGKERHTAIARFEELKKQYPGIASVKDIEKSKWER